MLATAPDIKTDSSSSLKWVVIGCYGLHLAVIALFALEIIPLHYRPRGSFLLFHHGGDEGLYYAQAQMVLSGKLRPAVYPFGFPLLLAPFVAIMGLSAIPHVMSAVSIFWGILMFPLGQWMLASMTDRITGSRKTAAATVAIWTLLPLLAYFALRVAANSTMAETWSTHLMWMQMLSDGPATLFTLLTMLVYFRGPKATKGALRGELTWGATLGALTGFVTLIRLPAAVIVLVVAVLLVVKKRFYAVAAAAVAGGLVLAPQLIYNARYLGGPLKTGYEALTPARIGEDIGPGSIVDSLGLAFSRIAPAWILLAVIPAIAILVLGLLSLSRRSKMNALAVGMWLGSFIAFNALYRYSWLHLARFMMPALPAAAILVAATLAPKGSKKVPL